MLVNPVAQRSQTLVRRIQKWRAESVARRHAVTQRQMNEAFEGTDFKLSLRYGEILNIVFVTCTFSAGMPVLIPMVWSTAASLCAVVCCGGCCAARGERMGEGGEATTRARVCACTHTHAYTSCMISSSRQRAQAHQQPPILILINHHLPLLSSSHLCCSAPPRPAPPCSVRARRQ